MDPVLIKHCLVKELPVRGLAVPVKTLPRPRLIQVPGPRRGPANQRSGLPLDGGHSVIETRGCVLAAAPRRPLFTDSPRIMAGGETRLR
ncbi:hypothetical protein SKAU_G00030880 [Synaphobranchus kaupii]|uniref:Uncharacterized protein n=1 Tax=Synaphobranchus kaupii TaxID=118154 RepID=A0A9Q1GDR1_SYNKA|nr:hypothetical protein SKAU_G00030880 [Synaphobranchus kaupii]